MKNILKFTYFGFCGLCIAALIHGYVSPENYSAPLDTQMFRVGIIVFPWSLFTLYMMCSDTGWRLWWAASIPFSIPGTVFVIFAKRKREERAGAERKRLEEEAERQRQFDATPEGQRLIAKWQSEIEAKRQRLYDALTDISRVSDKVAWTLMDQYPAIVSIKGSSSEQLTDIPGVGMSIAKAIKARLG